MAHPFTPLPEGLLCLPVQLSVQEIPGDRPVHQVRWSGLWESNRGIFYIDLTLLAIGTLTAVCTRMRSSDPGSKLMLVQWVLRPYTLFSHVLGCLEQMHIRLRSYFLHFNFECDS